MDDVWSGLAYLLADLIAKHAAEITLDDEPTFQKNNTLENYDDFDLTIDKSNAA